MNKEANSLQDRKAQFETLRNEIGVAMLTTRTSSGDLRSRAMANQKAASGADLWFVTAGGSQKLSDISADPHINLSYYKDRTREWISVSGHATVTKEKSKIEELYASDWKMWFSGEGHENDPIAGTVDDPRITLIGIQIQHVTYFAVDLPAPVVMYEMAKGWVTGTPPKIGEVKTLEGAR